MLAYKFRPKGSFFVRDVSFFSKIFSERASFAFNFFLFPQTSSHFRNEENQKIIGVGRSCVDRRMLFVSLEPKK